MDGALNEGTQRTARNMFSNRKLINVFAGYGICPGSVGSGQLCNSTPTPGRKEETPFQNPTVRCTALKQRFIESSVRCFTVPQRSLFLHTAPGSWKVIRWHTHAKESFIIFAKPCHPCQPRGTHQHTHSGIAGGAGVRKRPENGNSSNVQVRARSV